MKNSASVAIICLSVLVVSIVFDKAMCNPQLTFSSDWSGGKRELENSKTISNDKLDLIDQDKMEKRSPGWGKRSPGWGKRSSFESTNLLKLINKLKEYEEKADELRNFLFDLNEMQNYDNMSI
ncbi:unnamed protein product [Brachionus calyciflorus]|uniref:Uncharacterized protein n=1 Tax=Brachionus calyciflorus TaxID=104777 RepID=A0A813RTA0_9BILA|nr:unnamed protein product [Brachionus calyciflorus]